MANWCDNILILQCNDPAQIQRVVKAYNEDRLLSEFIPEPKTVDPESIRDWRDQNWGTSWEIGKGDDMNSIIISETGTQITLSFQSDWEPPLVGMKAFEEAGFSVELYYWDYDTLSGQYMTGDDQGYLNVVGYWIKVKELYPDRFNAVFGIS